MIDCVKFSTPRRHAVRLHGLDDAFSAGKTAMMLMWATIGGTVFDPETSKVADTIDVAVPDGRTASPSAAAGASASRRTRRTRTRAWARDHVPHLQGVGEVPGRHVQDRPEPHLDVQRSRSGQDVPVPAGRRARRLERAQILPLAHMPETFEIMTACAEEFATALRRTPAADACQGGERQLDRDPQARRPPGLSASGTSHAGAVRGE